jgi:hypothetical protein
MEGLEEPHRKLDLGLVGSATSAMRAPDVAPPFKEGAFRRCRGTGDLGLDHQAGGEIVDCQPAAVSAMVDQPGNLRLITREATDHAAVLPRAPVHYPGPRHRLPRYVWKLRRRERIARKRALACERSASAPRQALCA